MIYNRCFQIILLSSCITISFAFLPFSPPPPPSSRTVQHSFLQQQRRPSSGQRLTIISSSINASKEKAGYFANTSMEKKSCECRRKDYIIETISMASSLIITSIPISSNAEEEKPSTFQKGKSRSVGYELQRTPSEWSTFLSISQLNVLRRGKTERQRASILEKEKRSGTYVCAGCHSVQHLSYRNLSERVDQSFCLKKLRLLLRNL